MIAGSRHLSKLAIINLENCICTNNNNDGLNLGDLATLINSPKLMALKRIGLDKTKFSTLEPLINEFLSAAN